MERIVGLVCCILCAFSLFVMGHYNKISREPITFWAGDKSLKEKVKDIQGYNDEILELYIICCMEDIQKYSIKIFMNFSLSEKSIYHNNKIGSTALGHRKNN